MNYRNVSSIPNRFGIDVERFAGEFLGVGRMWAAHGLNAGCSALEASAKTLAVTARLLGELSSRVGVSATADVAVRSASGTQSEPTDAPVSAEN